MTIKIINQTKLPDQYKDIEKPSIKSSGWTSGREVVPAGRELHLAEAALLFISVGTNRCLDIIGTRFHLQTCHINLHLLPLLHNAYNTMFLHLQIKESKQFAEVYT